MATPLTYELPIQGLLQEEGLEQIHQASMRILSEFGIEFWDEEVREVLKKHGARFRGDIATFDPAMIMEYVAKAPSSFIQRARNPANNVQIGGNQIVFAPVYGPPFVRCAEKGRRRALLEDFQNFVKLAYLSPYMHHSGGTVVEPNDEPVETRHLDMVFSHIKYSDKPFMGSVTSTENAADTLQQAEILFGREVMRNETVLLSLINVNSPRRYDERMLGALKTYARARQGLIITPFILAGAMGPVSMGGTLAQLNAEALAGIALAQMIQPGTPVVYGSFLATVYLRSGSPTFGTPESQVGLYVSSQLARRYKLPFRSSGMFASSKIPDAQAAYESVMSMLPGVMARTNFVLHSAGWLENGLCAGYEKFVLDCEVLGMLHTLARGLDLSEEGMAFDSIAEVEPGGHYLGTEHTLRNYRTAFYEAELFDYKHFEAWDTDGAEDSIKRASRKVKQLLAEYQPPPLDAAIEEELRAFMARRKEALLHETSMA